MKSQFPLIHIFLLLAASYSYVGAQNVENSGQSSESTFSKVVVYGDLIIGVASSATINIEGKMVSSASNKTHLYLRGGYGAETILLAGGGPGGLGALTLLSSRRRNHLALSAGVFVFKSTDDEVFRVPLLDLGYRWQKPEGGFLFGVKVGVAGIGTSIGYAF